MSSATGRLLISTLVLSCAALAWHSRSHAARHYEQTQVYEDVYYLPPPWALEVFSLGHRAALADLIWLRALVYFGDELIHRGNVRHLYAYGDAMLVLDPDFKKVYRWLATSALYRTGNVTAQDSERAIAYLERGVRRFPDDCELAWDLGAQYTYELPAMLESDEAREAARSRGLPHLAVAVRLGCGPPWLALNNAARLVKQGQREQAIRQLLEVYSTISDPAVKEQILFKIGKLRSEGDADAVQRTWSEFEARRKRDFPYADPGLYLLLGPRPPFDGNALRLRGFDPVEEQLDDQAAQ